jgi:hypothetical protein
LVFFAESKFYYFTTYLFIVNPLIKIYQIIIYIVIRLVFFHFSLLKVSKGFLKSFGFPLIIKFLLLSPIIATFIVEILLRGEKRKEKE